MAKKKKKTKKSKVSRKKKKKPSRKKGSSSEKKHQRQIYITQGLIDDLETLRAAKENETREKLGYHCDLSWSQYVGSVLHDHARRMKAKAK